MHCLKAIEERINLYSGLLLRETRDERLDGGAVDLLAGLNSSVD